MGEVKFSVIIPLFNKEDSIKKALESVLNQSYQDFEIVVVDDGSRDSSYERAFEVKDSRIRVIRQENGGVSAARNRGVEEARYEYVTFLDADDEWDRDFLQIIADLIDQYPECMVYGTNYRLRDCHGKYYPTTINGLEWNKQHTGVVKNYFEVAAKSSPPICSICVAMRKGDLQAIGGFPLGIKSGEDLLTWARLLVQGNLAYCRAAHSTYNLDEGYEYGAQPVRRQDTGDPVGKSLGELLSKYPTTIGLRKYISHWHKMRASVAIRFGESRETMMESWQALKYNPGNLKVLPFIVLACLPKRLRKRIIGMKKH